MIYDGDILGVEIAQTLSGGWVAVVIDNRFQRHYADIKGIIPCNPPEDCQQRYDAEHLADALSKGLGVPFKPAPAVDDPTPAQDDQIVFLDSNAPLQRIEPPELLADGIGHLIDAVDLIRHHADFDPHDQGEVKDFLDKAGRALREYRDARRQQA